MGISELCDKSGFILQIIVNIFKWLRILIPILLIVLISFDFAKVVAGQADDKVKKEATTKAVKRLIYAVIIFLVPTVVSFVLKQIDPVTNDNAYTNATETSWISCWNYYYNKQ